MIQSFRIISLSSRGHKRYPVYDIVVMWNKKGHGLLLETLGFFSVNNAESSMFLDLYKLGYWLNSGASLHISVNNYMFYFINN